VVTSYSVTTDICVHSDILRTECHEVNYGEFRNIPATRPAQLQDPKDIEEDFPRERTVEL
jgi:hypothetical protein